MNRERVSSGSAMEQEYAYSRAVVQGDWIFVSGTTGVDYSTMTLPEDVAEQAERCFINIAAALEKASATLDDAVRVTYYLRDRSDFSACAAVIRKYLDAARPACTAIQADLLNPDWKIEIEVTALRVAADGKQ